MPSRSTERKRAPRLPPRWFIRGAWVAHRAIHRFTGGRRGLATPTSGAAPARSVPPSSVTTRMVRTSSPWP